MATCWECDNCGWQVLDPQLELGSAACLCGVGAGRWLVSTARLPRAVADGGEIPIPLKPSPGEAPGVAAELADALEAFVRQVTTGVSPRVEGDPVLDQARAALRKAGRRP